MTLKYNILSYPTTIKWSNWEKDRVINGAHHLYHLIFSLFLFVFSLYFVLILFPFKGEYGTQYEMRKSGCRGITYERSETSGPAPSRRTDAHGSLEGQRYFFILFWPSPQSRDDQYVAGLQQKVARFVPHPFTPSTIWLRNVYSGV